MVKLELSEQMIMVIGRALEQMPYSAVKTTIEELQRQINAQGLGQAPAKTNGAERAEHAVA